MKKLEIVKSNTEKTQPYILTHLSSLSFPIDSFIEDMIISSDKYEILYDGIGVGYFSAKDNILNSFHILPTAYVKAPDILEHIVNEYKIEKITVITQDSQINALIMEWDIEIERMGCFFIDSGSLIENNTQLQNASFRYATQNDINTIRAVCGDFFDEPSNGYITLEDRIADSTIFMLVENDTLYACGIIEKSTLMPPYVSIGMYTNPAHRNMGAAKTILLNLKKWAYDNKLKPVSGCWYYNTLSRKSLESAGMIAASFGYYGKIIKKDKPPKRTGNPPGILLE